MSSSLSMRKIRRHPEVLTEAADLEPGLNVALCSFLPSISRGMRCGQALIALVSDSRPESVSRWRYMKEGFKHSPTWGIIIDHVGSVNWVNTDSAYPRASLQVTRTSMDLPPAEWLGNPAHSVEDVAARAQQVPKVEGFGLYDEPFHDFELRTSFADLGLAQSASSMSHFIVKLSA